MREKLKIRFILAIVDKGSDVNEKMCVCEKCWININAIFRGDSG